MIGYGLVEVSVCSSGWPGFASLWGCIHWVSVYRHEFAVCRERERERV